MTLGDALQSRPRSSLSRQELAIEQKILQTKAASRPLIIFMSDIRELAKHIRPNNNYVKSRVSEKIVKDWGIRPADNDSPEAQDQRTSFSADSNFSSTSAGAKKSSTQQSNLRPGGNIVQAVSSPTYAPLQPAKQENVEDSIAQLDPKNVTSVAAGSLSLRKVKSKEVPVPQLAHDLRRVLFNPGVYQLQDSRSGVFNFDSYLQRMIPVSEFNFEALNDYITSSKDEYLHYLGRQNKKKYIGSSSSLTGILGHFHFLLSHYRKIDLSSFSREFANQADTFTQINRCPSAQFLIHQNGLYAVDADKEFDTANELMELGKSMEKLLTLPKHKYEEFRRTGKTGTGEADNTSVDPEVDPEAYSFCQQGNVLMRSQLDAYDPQLPGTGLFDLKSRAVVSIRFNVNRMDEVAGYEIRSRHGWWGSYEREYYDMLRSAMLKYSLQARMGQMDGIMVVYHNVERIFGFQYLPLTEIDQHLHGQEDPDLGDAEFRLSVKLMNEVFDRATRRFPDKSLRFYCESRPGAQREPGPKLDVFAQPYEEHEIDEIQHSNQRAVAEFQNRLLHRPPAESEAYTGLSLAEALTDDKPSDVTDPKLQNTTVETERPIYAATVRIVNKLNGRTVVRPSDYHDGDDWAVDYEILEHAELTARARLMACRNRRKALLADSKKTGGFFDRTIQKLAKEGGAWRKMRDEAQSELKLLYPDRV